MSVTWNATDATDSTSRAYQMTYSVTPLHDSVTLVTVANQWRDNGETMARVGREWDVWIEVGGVVKGIL